MERKILVIFRGCYRIWFFVCFFGGVVLNNETVDTGRGQGLVEERTGDSSFPVMAQYGLGMPKLKDPSYPDTKLSANITPCRAHNENVI